MTNTARSSGRFPLHRHGWVAVVTAFLASGCGAGGALAGPEPTGSLEITMTGLPGGLQGRMVVTGPTTSDTLLASTTLNNLTPGSYTISAEDIDTEDAAHLPEPAVQTVSVSAGIKTTSTVEYTRAPPRTGGFFIEVEGLPAGESGAVMVTGPRNFRHFMTRSTVADGLVVGDYTIAAESVILSGVTYNPDPASQTLEVTKDTIRGTTVRYQLGGPATGALSLTTSGLPAGAAASVRITGPNGFDQLVTTTTTINGATVGSYTLTSQPVVVAGTTYGPRDPTLTVSITAGATTTETVMYVAAATTVGSLAVAVSGLPLVVVSPITVTGPNGFSQTITATTTIDGLAPGSYNVAAANVVLSGVTLFASPASQVAVVTAGATTTKSVAYAVAPVTTGTLGIVTSGLPSGAAASVSVSSPNGFVQAVTNTTSISGAAVGNYTITAQSVVVAGATYLPSAGSQSATVVAGITSTVTVAYTIAPPTVGTLTVSVTGLGSGVAAAITVTGPNNFRRTLTAGATVDSLAPGTYTIAAADVVVSGVTHIAAPASQTAVIAAGSNTNRSVAYAVAPPTIGQLTVTVNGLAAGTAASVVVTGPNGYSRTLTSTTTIASLEPGTYTVTASNVTAGGVSMLPTPTSQTAAVTAGATATRAVTYTAAALTTGLLTVTVSGLPGGVASAITVTGPSGYSHAVTASETIAALPVGSYAIAAGNVTSGLTSYAPSALSQSASVVAGNTATRTVAYSAVVSSATVTVDTTVRFQQIRGWEATSQAGQAEPGFSGWQSELMDLAANDLGINRIRLEIASGTENSVDYYAQFRAGQITSTQYNATRYAWVNDNADPNSPNPSGFKWSKLDESIEVTVLPMRQRLAARGEALYVNLNYVSFGGSTAQQSPAEYAELILATFQHMRSQFGFVPNAVEIILEPDNNTIRTGNGIGGLIAATGARLAAAGFHPDFIAPSVMNMANAVSYFDQLVAVSGARTYLTDIAYHRYAGVSDGNLSAIRSRAEQYGIRTGMLEHIGSGVEDLYRDLTLANASAWQQYTLAYPTPDNGGHYYGIEGGRPVMGSRTVALRQYFRYVRSGAWRVQAASTNGSVRPVAFTNPGSGMAVVLHIDAAGTYSVRGMRNGSYEVKMATSAGAVVTLPNVTVTTGGSVTISPATTGVLTLSRMP